ncbi:MAG: thioredoxin [Acidimicrobiales bacterium]
MTDVTDATFNTAVIERSATLPVVVDLWAPWCGPCKTLGPIIERVVAATGGKVELVKVNVDENPQVSQAFQVQGIPAVFAIKDGQVVDSFVGAQGEQEVQAFVDRLLPTEEEDTIEALLEKGDEASFIEVLSVEPDNPRAVTGLAGLLIEQGETDTALELLQRIPESPETRHLSALARSGDTSEDEIVIKLDGLLTQVKADEDARQEFLDLLELLGPSHELTGEYRRRLSSALF